MSPGESADLWDIAANADGCEGVIWTLVTSDDLNANLVRFGADGGVGEHVNDEVDILLIGMAGSGVVAVNRVEHRLYPGALVLVPKGAGRSTHSVSDDFSYLTVHRRRGPLRLGNFREMEEEA